MCSTVSPANDRIRIEIRRGNAPAIGFDVALSEATNLSSLAQASARAMGFSTFVAFNRLQRSPELWLTLALASLRLALAPAFDHRAAAARRAVRGKSKHIGKPTDLASISGRPWLGLFGLACRRRRGRFL